MSADPEQIVRIRILGQITTHWLRRELEKQARGLGLTVMITEGGFDNVLQEVLAETADSYDAVIMIPWIDELSCDGDEADWLIQNRLGFWKSVWQKIESTGPHILQVGYDYMGPGPDGYLYGTALGSISTIRRLNDEMRNSLPSTACFVDLDAISGRIGKSRFYSPRQYHWTKCPFSEEGSHSLAAHLAAALRYSWLGSRKCLVLDLDDTLWGGVAGEVGWEGVELGPAPEGQAYRSFQSYCLRLSQRGVMLAVASKNNESDAREIFEKRSDMILHLSDFVAFNTGWNPKSDMIREIATRLRIGIESMVFFDDNPVEREEIHMNLPQVQVIDVPKDPADFVRVMEESLVFEASLVTPGDRHRVEQYRTEEERSSERSRYDTLEDFLTSLGMTAVLEPVHSGNLPRVAQLVAKTNQFNLNTRRYSESRIQEMVYREGSLSLALDLRDRFGDYGITGVLIALGEKSGLQLFIDTFLLSCRIINRSAEHYMMNHLVMVAKERGCETLIGEFRPSPKNSLVSDLYPRLGFKSLTAHEGADRYLLRLDDYKPLACFVQDRNLSENCRR